MELLCYLPLAGPEWLHHNLQHRLLLGQEDGTKNSTKPVLERMNSGILENKVLVHWKLNGDSSRTVKKFDQATGMLTCSAEMLPEEKNLA